MSRSLLEAAFRATTYRVETAEGVFDLRIESRHPAFDDFLRRQGASCWGIVTACNPGASPLREAENQERQSRLLDRVSELGWTAFKACNRADEGAWLPEPGLLLLRADEACLRCLAAEFGQLAFIVGTTGTAPRLAWT